MAMKSVASSGRDMLRREKINASASPLANEKAADLFFA
jgi:hypothetical protein